MPNLLNELQIAPEYRTDDASDLVQDFYIPCLERSVLYRRAVGYFTSHGIALAARGIDALLNNGGKMRLVASPQLSEADRQSIEDGYKSRDQVITETIVQELEYIDNDEDTTRLSYLSKLIADGNLEIQLAIQVNSQGKIRRGLFHEKIGVFSDSENNEVAFTGSVNETVGGLVDNFESIDVYWSWEDPHDRTRRKRENFDRLWSKSTKGLEIVEFPEAARRKLIKIQPPPKDGAVSEPAPQWGQPTPANPTWLELRDYQKEAIDNWISADHQGFFNMATGTGKTITALAAMIELLKSKDRLVILIACPNTHLVLQWEKEAQKFGFIPILAFDSRGKWSEKLNRAISRYNRETSDVEVIITTNATLTSKNNALQNILKKVSPNDICFIADEAHNLGAFKTRQRLPENYKYRLALSATPTRYFDDVGSQFLFKYFGESVIEILLGYAIENGFLSKYKYYPHLVYLNGEETEEYLTLSKKIQKLSYLMNSEDNDDGMYQRLLEKRVAILNNASAKYDCLAEVLDGFNNLQKSLFYCSDKQIDNICEFLLKEKKYFIKRVTYKDPAIERSTIFREFEDGLVQALVAIGVLDEGLDIPSTDTAFILASTGNPKQFVQRRGRVLRKPPKGEKIASIHDFIALPDDSIGDDKFVKKALERELRRFKEFAETAENSLEAIEVVWDIAKKYNLIGNL